MNPSHQEKTNKYRKGSLLYALILIGIVAFLFLGMPDSILYATTGFLKWLPFVLIFIVIPVLLFRTLLGFTSIFGSKIWLILAIPLASILILGPSFGIYTDHYKNTDLLENGTKTKGIIAKKWYSIAKSYKGYYIQCEFKVDSLKFLTFSKKDENNIYKIGDTMTILYSKKNPQNNKILLP